ncbi:MAG: flagellar assembly protein FliX [Alphaproteobacteria bacterium]
MKVGGPGRISTPGVRAGGSKKAAGGFRVDQGGRAGGVSAAGPTNAMASIDALVALQGAGAVEDATTGKRRAVKRASKLLDLLDELRVALLEGRIPTHHLNALMTVIESQRHASDDPKLAALLEEIELRAQVELAKVQSHLKSAASTPPSP